MTKQVRAGSDYVVISPNTRLSIPFAALLLAACASASPTPSDRLQGEWGASVNGCIWAIAFEGQRYELDQICKLASGAFGVETDVGTFAASSSRLLLYPSKSSCKKGVITGPFGLSFSDEELNLIGPGTTIVLDRIPHSSADGNGAVIDYGCWGQGDTFTPATIRPL